MGLSLRVSILEAAALIVSRPLRLCCRPSAIIPHIVEVEVEVGEVISGGVEVLAS